MFLITVNNSFANLQTDIWPRAQCFVKAEVEALNLEII